MQVSKEVQRVRDFEKTLLRSYQARVAAAHLILHLPLIPALLTLKLPTSLTAVLCCGFKLSFQP